MAKVWEPAPPTQKQKISVAIYLIGLTALISNRIFEWNWFHPKDDAILLVAVLLGLIGSRFLPRPSDDPAGNWSVMLDMHDLITTDGTGAERRIPVQALTSVVVATDDSGPWGDDVVFLLFAGEPEAATIFPLEARGCQGFVEYLSKLPGYNDKAMATAMGSTSVARFIVWERLN